MKHYLFAISLLVPVFFMGCKKSNDCTAGSGGNLTLVAKTMHHTKAIPGCTLYIKYCTQELPGNGNATAFDKSFKIANDSVEIAISNLQKGDYYLYAVGIDSTLDPTKNIVKGGIPFSTDQYNGIINLIVPVTEGD